MSARVWRSVIGIVVVAALLGACSKSSNSTSGGASTTLKQGSGGLVFTPATLSVKKGDTISVQNVGSTAHTFTVTGQSIDVTNDAGKSQDVTIDLAPGTYPFICRFHESSGMKGTLTVTG
jgi:plastocyanin